MSKRKYNSYKSYSFEEQDPVIDALRTAVSASRKSYAELHEESGVAVSTVHSWFSGRTRRPQFATVAAMIRATGKRGVVFAHNSGNPKLIG